MFFYLSKIVWFMLQPSALLLIGLLCGVALLFTRFGSAGRRLIALATLGLVVGAFSPVGNWLIWPLEQRFARPDLEASGVEPAGVIMLGGALSTSVASARGVQALNENAERVTETLTLARRYPNLVIVFSGGSNQFIRGDNSEASIAEDLLQDLLGSGYRVLLEDRSRNTRENAVLTAAMLPKDRDRPWLLVTSAYHMPRSVGCFRRAGVDVVAWPVDFRTRGPADLWKVFYVPSNGLRRLDLVAKEWLGLLAYWMAGYTDELLARQG